MPFTKENAGEYARRRWAKMSAEERSAYASRIAKLTRKSWIDRRAKTDATGMSFRELLAELGSLKARLRRKERLQKKAP